MDSTSDKVDDTDNSTELDPIDVTCWLDSASKDELDSLVDDRIVHSGQWVIITVVFNVAVSVETIIDPFSVVVWICSVVAVGITCVVVVVALFVLGQLIFVFDVKYVDNWVSVYIVVFPLTVIVSISVFVEMLVIVASQFVSWLVIDVDKIVVIGEKEEMVVLDVVVTGNDDDNKLENWSVVDSSVDELGS